MGMNKDIKGRVCFVKSFMMFNKAPHSNLDCQAVVWASLGYLKGISRWKTAGSKSLQNTLCIRMQPHSPTNLWRPTFCVTRCFLATAPRCACPGLKSSLCRSGHKVPVAGCCGSNHSWIHGNSVGHLECSPHPIRMRTTEDVRPALNLDDFLVVEPLARHQHPLHHQQWKLSEWVPS